MTKICTALCRMIVRSAACERAIYSRNCAAHFAKATGVAAAILSLAMPVSICSTKPSTLPPYSVMRRWW